MRKLLETSGQLSLGAMVIASATVWWKHQRSPLRSTPSGEALPLVSVFPILSQLYYSNSQGLLSEFDSKVIYKVMTREPSAVDFKNNKKKRCIIFYSPVQPSRKSFARKINRDIDGDWSIFTRNTHGKIEKRKVTSRYLSYNLDRVSCYWRRGRKDNFSNGMLNMTPHDHKQLSVAIWLSSNFSSKLTNDLSDFIGSLRDPGRFKYTLKSIGYNYSTRNLIHSVCASSADAYDYHLFRHAILTLVREMLLSIDDSQASACSNQSMRTITNKPMGEAFYKRVNEILRDYANIASDFSSEAFKKIIRKALPDWNLDTLYDPKKGVFPQTNPLNCFPVQSLSGRKAGLRLERLVPGLKLKPGKKGRFTQLLPRAECPNDEGFLSRKEFQAALLKSSHGSCKTKIYADTIFQRNPQAMLIGNVRHARRALYALHAPRFRNKSESTITEELSKKLASHKLFRADSPFVIMQRFILYLNHQLKQLAGRGADILGDFKPVTHPEQYPIPLFTRADGHLLGFFWHGTAVENSRNIVKTNFLLGHSSAQFYGPGTYFAIQACKALQYTADEKETLLLVAVFLGKNPFFHQRGTRDPGNDTSWVRVAVPGYANNGRQAHWEFISANEFNIVPLLQVTLFDEKHHAKRPHPKGEFRRLQSCHVM